MTNNAVVPGARYPDGGYYHQVDIYLNCHTTSGVTNKNIYSYILRDADNHLESFDRLAKDSEVGQKSQHERIQRWRWFFVHIYIHIV